MLQGITFIARLIGQHPNDDRQEERPHSRECLIEDIGRHFSNPVSFEHRGKLQLHQPPLSGACRHFAIFAIIEWQK